VEAYRVFHILPYHKKILLGDFNAKVNKEDNFKPVLGNESLHEISNDNGLRSVNSGTSRKLPVKMQCPHITTFINIQNINININKSININIQNDHILMDR
jgi:hypothetical protein